MRLNFMLLIFNLALINALPAELQNLIFSRAGTGSTSLQNSAGVKRPADAQTPDGLAPPLKKKKPSNTKPSQSPKPQCQILLLPLGRLQVKVTGPLLKGDAWYKSSTYRSQILKSLDGVQYEHRHLPDLKNNFRERCGAVYTCGVNLLPENSENKQWQLNVVIPAVEKNQAVAIAEEALNEWGKINWKITCRMEDTFPTKNAVELINLSMLPPTQFPYRFPKGPFKETLCYLFHDPKNRNVRAEVLGYYGQHPSIGSRALSSRDTPNAWFEKYQEIEGINIYPQRPIKELKEAFDQNGGVDSRCSVFTKGNALPLVWHLVCVSGILVEGEPIDVHGFLTRVKGVLEGWHGFPNPKSFNCQWSVADDLRIESWIGETEKARKTGFDPNTEEA